MPRASGIIAAMLLAATASTARAQLLIEPTDEMVQQAAQAVRANLTLARLADGSPVPAETPAELAQPIVPFALDRQTVRRGVLTGEFQACGGDWQADSFERYMARMRDGAKLTGKQLTYLGMLHGFIQEQVYEALRTRVRSCSKGRIETLAKMTAEPIPLP